MPRRHSTSGTLVLLVFVLGFAWASYHFIVEKRVFANDSHPAPPASEIEHLRGLCDEALARDEWYDGIASFNWRQTDSRYRVDVHVRDGCPSATYRAMAKKLSGMVERGTDGGHAAEVGVLMLGREVYHYVP